MGSTSDCQIYSFHTRLHGMETATFTGRGRHKVIVLGEHAVVYGHPALGAPLDEGVSVSVRTTGRSSGIEPIGVTDPDRLGEALGRMAARAGFGGSGLEVRVESGLPAGAGLGGSAALCVAFARALLGIAGRREDDDLVIDIAGEGERVFHSNPSGIDAWLASSDTPALFTRGQRPRPLDVHEDLHLAILVDEEISDTARMVQGVAARRASDPEGIEAILERIHELVLGGAEAIRSGDRAALGNHMTTNHDLLAKLGVTTQGLDRLRDLALARGALGAKMTGGGGGGAVIALVEDGESSRRMVRDAPGRGAFTATIPATGRTQ